MSIHCTLGLLVAIATALIFEDIGVDGTFRYGMITAGIIAIGTIPVFFFKSMAIINV